MYHTIVALFAVAALGGLTLAALHFRGRPRPWGLAILHGVVAAAALVFLIVAVSGGGSIGLTRTSLALFVVAAFGGIYLFTRHLQKKPLPSPVVIVHGGVAVTAFVLLLAAVYGRP